MSMISVCKKLYLDKEIRYVKDIVIKNARIKDVMSNLNENSYLNLFLREFPLYDCDIMDLKIKKYKKGEFSCINKWHYDFVEEYDNPSPHEICIVSKIVGKQTISPTLLPIITEAPRINTE